MIFPKSPVPAGTATSEPLLHMGSGRGANEKFSWNIPYPIMLNRDFRLTLQSYATLSVPARPSAKTDSRP